MGLVGLLWIGQGLGAVKGSVMTGQVQWTVIGLVVLALAVWQLVALRRGRG
jgi:hypothetical protein